jgi:hypothetical protein
MMSGVGNLWHSHLEGKNSAIVGEERIRFGFAM